VGLRLGTLLASPRGKLMDRSLAPNPMRLIK
jgi:hypothetical protein